MDQEFESTVPDRLSPVECGGLGTIRLVLPELVTYSITKCNFNKHVHMYKCTCTSEFLIGFEAWAKLAQHWLVCAPLGIHLEPINKQLMLLVTIIIIIINYAIWPKERTV